MTSAQRITLNVFATYGRTIISIVLGLFSGRWVLEALGDVDFGLTNVVGSLIVFVTFFGGITSGAVVRFLAYSIGKGDLEETNKWFNVALIIHIIFPAIIILSAWPIGEWAVDNFLNIPSSRIETAHWVLRLSLIATFCNFFSTPYISMFTAKQRIYEISVWGFAQTLLNFSFFYYLRFYTKDVWLLYSLGTVLILIFIGMCQLLRARHLFPECKINLEHGLEYSKFKQLLSFSGWNFFGNLGFILRGQGLSILLNKYFPPDCFPHVNASYSVANTVSGYTSMLSSALVGALVPEITANEGRGDRSRMLMFSNGASKFGTVFVLLFAIPLFVEVDYVLKLWLKNPPSMTGIFCQWTLIMFIIDRLTTGDMIAVSANGKIAGYQVTLGGVMILTLPLSWLFLSLGFDIISVFWASAITMTMCSVGRVIWSMYLVDSSPLKWVKEVLLLCLLMIICGFAAGYGVRHICGEESFFRLCAVTFATVTSWLLLGWFVVLNKAERNFLGYNLSKVAKKMGMMKII
jgi:O-antigen/teichoic acid export membrane protein